MGLAAGNALEEDAEVEEAACPAFGGGALGVAAAEAELVLGGAVIRLTSKTSEGVELPER